MDKESNIQINLLAPINGTSYGITSINLLIALMDIGVKVSLFPITLIERDIPQYAIPYIKEAIGNSKKPDFNAPCIRIWHQFDMSQFVGRGKKIGFPIFELDGFNDVERHHLESLDYCFVCSNWAKEILVKHNILAEEKIAVIPLGVDPKIFYPTPTARKSAEYRYVFLNMGKWEIRKGHDILPEIFTNAFNSDMPVELWMCNYNVHLSKEENMEWERYYRSAIPSHQLKILDRLPTQQDVARIMNMVDCGIFPAKAEGWNLEATELLACGKDIIIGNHTGQSEYAQFLPYSFHVENDVSAYDGKWFFGQGTWKDVNASTISNIVHFMREAFQNKGKNYEENLKLSAQFHWSSSARKIENFILNCDGR